MLYYSKTTHETIQQCEQKHYYKNVRRLRPFVGDFAPEMGKLIHVYLAGYYAGLKMGMTYTKAHEAGHLMLEADGKKVTAAVDTAFFAGDEEAALLYSQLMPTTRALCDGYWKNRGKHDADMYEVLYVEEIIDAKISTSIRSRSVLDLVMRERDGGLVGLWEHKSTKSVPDAGIRMRDLQTLLYKTVGERKFQVEIDKIVWNYIRTKLPQQPHLNKPKGKNPPEMSKAVGIDTTWEVYEQALLDADLDPENYMDVRSRLYNAEYTKYFPRFEHVVVAQGSVLLRDYVVQAKRTEALERGWEAGKFKPIRHLDMNCTWCSFLKVCEAELTGGDPEDVIKMRFSTPEQRQAPQTPWLEEYEDA